ncbi:MAG: ABC transporter permease [Candidatus Thermoplasmatota archaeon]
MSSLVNIIRKELKELLTPATFLPIIIMAVVFMTMGNTMGGIEEQIQEKPVIGYIDLDEGNFSDIALDVVSHQSKVVFNSTDYKDKQQGLKNIRDEEGIALLLIPENFTKKIKNGLPGEIKIFWIMKGAGLLDTISSESVNLLLQKVDRNISQYLINQNTLINASNVLSPTHLNSTTFFKNKEFNNLSPGQITNVLSSQSTTIPIVMMMIIIMSGGMVISSMAMEKENKTLETLLTLPVKRTSIVTGKIIASAIIGLLLTVIYMLGLGYWMQSFGTGGQINLSEYNLVLTSTDLIIIGVIVFVTLVAALSLCMLLGTMAKNYKAAQTLTFPVTLLALVPMFLTMFKDFDTLPSVLKGVVFAIPFSHPMMAPRALIFDNYLFVAAGLAYVSFFAIAMISLTVWVFKTDRLITGMSKREGSFLKYFRR